MKVIMSFQIATELLNMNMMGRDLIYLPKQTMIAFFCEFFEENVIEQDFNIQNLPQQHL